MAANIPSTSSQPYTTTFSFTAPFPPSPSSSAQAQSLAKQRRVSLALPSDSSPRIFPAWTFRDDTGLGVHSVRLLTCRADADVLAAHGTPALAARGITVAARSSVAGADTNAGAAASA